jgi:hypothetical protein
MVLEGHASEGRRGKELGVQERWNDSSRDMMLGGSIIQAASMMGAQESVANFGSISYFQHLLGQNNHQGTRERVIERWSVKMGDVRKKNPPQLPMFLTSLERCWPRRFSTRKIWLDGDALICAFQGVP